MVKKSKKAPELGLPLNTRIEVIGLKEGKKPFKKEMTYGEALNLPKKKGWNYVIYQLGFSQFNID